MLPTLTKRLVGALASDLMETKEEDGVGIGFASVGHMTCPVSMTLHSTGWIYWHLYNAAVG